MDFQPRWQTLKSRLMASDLKDYSYEVNHENMSGMLMYLFLGEFIALTALAAQWIGGMQSNYVHCIEMVLYYGVLLACYYLYKKEWTANATAWLYTWEVLAFIMLIFQAAAFDTDKEAFLVPVCLVIFPLFLIDVPWRLYLMVLTMAGVFLLWDHYGKPAELFRRDLLHIIWCLPVSFLLSYRNIYSRLLGKIEKQKATQTAEHDVLTGLLNRRGGEQLIRDCLENGVSGSYILMDIDNFKFVNDNYGHGRGDEILVAAGSMLQKCFRDGDIVFRMGGDEFVVYAPSMVDLKNVEQKLGEICRQMRSIMIDPDIGAHITVSLGCVINLGSYPSYEAIYETADYFLYQTKWRSKNGFSIGNVDYKPDEHKAEKLKQIR